MIFFLGFSPKKKPVKTYVFFGCFNILYFLLKNGKEGMKKWAKIEGVKKVDTKCNSFKTSEED